MKAVSNTEIRCGFQLFGASDVAVDESLIEGFAEMTSSAENASHKQTINLLPIVYSEGS